MGKKLPIIIIVDKFLKINIESTGYQLRFTDGKGEGVMLHDLLSGWNWL